MKTFYFYDLETSGRHPRKDRIMQFAGQRTRMDLVPIGDPDDLLVSLSSDILPDPEAILLTGITPQRTRDEGFTEKQFAEHFLAEIATPDTVFVGYNSVRFDDEFIRALLYRSLHDPYEWQWKDGRSRWDLLDVVRMTRALRPEGIHWPMAERGKPSNRLEDLTRANNLEHTAAHSALSDVTACIEVARLIRSTQPKLFEYLFNMRSKKDVEELVSTHKPFVYTSGRYPGQYEHTTVAVAIEAGPASALVYDLRHEPAGIDFSSEERSSFPVKELKYNQCPSIAPLGVLDKGAYDRLNLTLSDIEKRIEQLGSLKARMTERYQELFPKEFGSKEEPSIHNVDEKIYDGFYSMHDTRLLRRIHDTPESELVDASYEFEDHRLEPLYFLFRARNIPKSLLAEDRQRYEQYVREKLLSGEPSVYMLYEQKLSELATHDYLDADKRYILEELALYGQSLIDLDSL